MTVKDIVEKFLKENGYDGLFAADECACAMPNLIPCCGYSIELCEPGYREPCYAGCECGIECPDLGSWHITGKKRKG